MIVIAVAARMEGSGVPGKAWPNSIAWNVAARQRHMVGGLIAPDIDTLDLSGGTKTLENKHGLVRIGMDCMGWFALVRMGYGALG